MHSIESRHQSYWNLLTKAESALAEGEFSTAEKWYLTAQDRREESPGRVFLTEKLTDGLVKLLRRAATRMIPTQQGRWARRAGAFRVEYAKLAESTVREALRLAELRPEDAAQANQPILTGALFLVSRSRLFPEEPLSAVPLLKGLFRTARRTGRPFDLQLVRHDLPLTEEDRLWLVSRGSELLESFIDHNHVAPNSEQAREWAHVFLQLVQKRYFGAASRLEEERCWLEAVTFDRLLTQAGRSVELFRIYLEAYPQPGPRSDEARVRLLELLANINGLHFPVPRYEEALRALQSAGLAAGTQMTGRYETALAIIEHRRPEAGPGEPSLGWASVGLESDGRVGIVYWWGSEPRDAAYWQAGDSLVEVEAFLEPCQGRVVAGEADLPEQLTKDWEEPPAPWTVRDFAWAVLESRLPATGLDQATLVKIALGETGPWREGWRAELGHPHLHPPRSSARLENWQRGPNSGAILAGLVWLGIRSRIAEADPAVRAGLGELARRGDPAASFLYDFLVLGRPADQAIDQGFEPWTLPLLWTRPDPFGWSGAGVRAGQSSAAAAMDHRPDLGRNDLAIVSTGDPAAVLAAWAEGRPRWRIVLDRMDRLDALVQVAGQVIGPVTVIPPGGKVHALTEALAVLDALLLRREREPARQAGLLPLFHWIRLVETHNGDLLDFLQVRPRPGLTVELFERYAELIQPLAQQDPDLNDEPEQAGWAGQFSLRVRRAGLVAGSVQQLAADPRRLDSLWGVFEGSEVSWVFLDSAAIHWELLRLGEEALADFHRLLQSRGRRHLSLLVGSVFQREQLEELLGSWLAVFGAPYCLCLTDLQTPVLRLAARGVVPDSRHRPLLALQQQFAYVRQAGAEQTLLVPSAGLAGEFWQDLADREGLFEGARPQFLSQDSAGEQLSCWPRAGHGSAGSLLVPQLASFSAGTLPLPQEGTSQAWRKADRERLPVLAKRRELCTLEVAALLAGPWSAVDIMDTRWWLSMPPVDSGDGQARVWSAASAAQVAAPQQSRLFDLPLLEAAARPAKRDPGLAMVADWYGARRAQQADAAVPAPGSLPAPGFQLLQSGLREAWQGLLPWVGEARELGDLSRWILLVGDQVPSEAAQLAQLAGGQGVSAWPFPRRDLWPGPLVWIQPEDFSDPVLTGWLAAHPPAAVVAGDLEEWLPCAVDPGLVGARALRGILACGAERVILHARNLPAAWRRFFFTVAPLRPAGAAAAKSQPAGGDAVADSCPRPWWPEASDTETEPQTRASGQRDLLFPGLKAAMLVSRLQNFLQRLRSQLDNPVTEAEGPLVQLGRVGGRRLASLSWLGCLAGVSGSDFASALRLLSWNAQFQGEALVWSEADQPPDNFGGDGHTLLLANRFADLEARILRLEDNLAVLLPLWLAKLPAGVRSWLDLREAPARLPDQEILQLDVFLSWARSAHGGCGKLLYECPRGILNSNRRLLGFEDDPVGLVEELRECLRLFRSRCADVMADAVDTGSEFRVDTGLGELREEERDFLALGAALGFWSWSGPPCPGAMHLGDLFALAESPSLLPDSPIWDLIGSLWPGPQDGGDQRADQADGRAAASSAESRPRDRASSLRGRLRLGGGHRDEELAEAADRVQGMILGRADTQLLVLRGLAGTGRHLAVLQGLAQAGQLAADLEAATFYCPDEGIAAQLVRDAWLYEIPGPLDIRIPGPGGLGVPPAGVTAYACAEGRSDLLVMCETQRFEPEIRYRIAQLGRLGSLIMTVDPAAAVEPWENLFLTTPRADDILTLKTQRRQAKRIWEEVRLLAGEQPGESGNRSGKKGTLVADYAHNLDHVLARLIAEVAAGRLPQSLRLSAPLDSDLDFLGNSLRDRGWLAEPAGLLANLQLPGTLDFLCAVADQLAVAGIRPGAVQDAPAADLTSQSKTEDTEAAASRLLLPRLLKPVRESEWRVWLEQGCREVQAGNMLDFARRLVGGGWLAASLAWPAARGRLENLLAGIGGESLGGLASSPLLEAWWYETLALLGLPEPAFRRPLVTLAVGDEPNGVFSEGGLYLCPGSEQPRVHYQRLNRISEKLLILYQEKSPLPSESLR